MLRRPAIVAVLAAALLASAPPRLSFAQSDSEVTAARKLYAEAVKDEEKKDFESALGKFRKVQSVKDTAGVRYRIATCLEGLGRLREALASYRGAADLAEYDPNQADVARASKEKSADIERRLPALTLTLSSKAPADAVVELDSKPVAASDLGKPISVDAGQHHVVGHATGAPPFDTQVTLPEGARFALTVPLDPASGPVGGNGQGQGQGQEGQGQGQGPGTGEGSGDSSKTVGWVLVGGGAALVAASGVTWLVRQSAISTMKDDCPNNRCPESKRSEVTSAKSRAQTMVPVTLVLLGGGLAAAGVGVYFLTKAPAEKNAVTEPAKPAARLVPVVGPGTAGLAVGGTF